MNSFVRSPSTQLHSVTFPASWNQKNIKGTHFTQLATALTPADKHDLTKVMFLNSC